MARIRDNQFFPDKKQFIQYCSLCDSDKLNCCKFISGTPCFITLLIRSTLSLLVLRRYAVQQISTVLTISTPASDSNSHNPLHNNSSKSTSSDMPELTKQVEKSQRPNRKYTLFFLYISFSDILQIYYELHSSILLTLLLLTNILNLLYYLMKNNS
jgi:hypothetical protein